MNVKTFLLDTHGPTSNSVSLNSGQSEMLRITAEGFYVRGQRVPADEHEAQTVYLAFKQWLAWSNLQHR
jgi:hypothetical protein